MYLFCTKILNIFNQISPKITIPIDKLKKNFKKLSFFEEVSILILKGRVSELHSSQRYCLGTVSSTLCEQIQ